MARRSSRRPRRRHRFLGGTAPEHDERATGALKATRETATEARDLARDGLCAKSFSTMLAATFWSGRARAELQNSTREHTKERQAAEFPLAQARQEFWKKCVRKKWVSD